MQGPGRRGGIQPLSLEEGHVWPPAGHPPASFAACQCRSVRRARVSGDAWGSRATAATVGRKSSDPATRQRASHAEKELAEGRRCGREPGLAQTLRQLSSFITVDADHEGSREQKPGQGFPGKAHSPQGWTGWEARLEKVGGRRPGDPPSPENVWRQRTPLPPTLCYTLIPQRDHGSPHETKAQLNKYSMRTQDLRVASFSVPRVSRSASRQEREGHVTPTCLELLPVIDGGEPPAPLGTGDGA